MPHGTVSYPRNAKEVAKIVKIGAKSLTPIILFGADTSLEGNVQAVNGGICIDVCYE